VKGILLAGGTGKRMKPLSDIDNKHLLPVFNKRMIELPISYLVQAGIRDIILITGGNRAGTFLELLKDGSEHGIRRLYYTYQKGSGGVAEALQLAEAFVDPYEEIVVLLGDNYFEDGISPLLTAWRLTTPMFRGCLVLTQETNCPWAYGIAVLDNTKKVVDIVEKPQDPSLGKQALLGGYLFDSSVWRRLRTIQPSVRGELEITDLLKCYLVEDLLSIVDYPSYWSDMGTFDKWAEVSQRIIVQQKNE